jgi:hypothetical protein
MFGPDSRSRTMYSSNSVSRSVIGDILVFLKRLRARSGCGGRKIQTRI